jgi:hypothetical protein
MPDLALLAVITIVILALVFDFTNGFHDAANAIATAVSTRALRPRVAVLLAAVLNFVGAFLSLEVAATVASDVVNPDVITQHLIFGGLVGAITWNMITWWFGLPISVSHSLIGGMVGAAFTAAGTQGVFAEGVFGKVLIPALIAPVVAFLLSDLSAGINGQIVRIAGEELSFVTHPTIAEPVLKGEWTDGAISKYGRFHLCRVRCFSQTLLQGGSRADQEGSDDRENAGDIEARIEAWICLQGGHGRFHGGGPRVSPAPPPNAHAGLRPDPADAERILAETAERMRYFRSLERFGGMRAGLSPHTPHTVSAPLLKGLAGLARQEGLPMQLHVAESPAEAAFHREGSGPLHELMKPFMPGWRPSGLSAVGYLASLGVLAARPTLVHMVHVSEDDIREVQRAGCAVVHCPRSNMALGCGRFPWELYMKHGLEVALGTDSRASSADLSLRQELKAARCLHGNKASPLALVRAAVKGGYRALGMRPPRFGRGDGAGILYRWP